MDQPIDVPEKDVPRSTIAIRYLSADNTGDRFPALIEECLSLKPDVIAVTTTPAAQLLKKATSTIPIVMVALGDPLGTGLVENLSKASVSRGLRWEPVASGRTFDGVVTQRRLNEEGGGNGNRRCSRGWDSAHHD